MKKGIIVLAVLLVALCGARAQAGEVDILVEKLVKHGVLSKDDATEILQETKIEAEKERQETIAATKEALMTGEDAKIMVANALPSFIRNTEFKGDLRLRYEYSDRENGNSDRNRGRYRFRLGMVTKVNEKVDVGFGIATGGSDPRSTNQTMGDSFSSPDVRLDMAYASYQPVDWLTFVGGKFENPLWAPVGWLWDGDIRPEGVSAVVSHTTAGGVELFMHNGFWILDEFKDSSSDPIMFVTQPGFKAKLGENAYFKGAFAYYHYEDVKDSELDFSSETNSRNPDNTYKYDQDAFVVSGELGTKNTGLDTIPFAALFGEYVQATDPSKDNTGYMFGAKFGHEKVKKPRQWQVKTYYERLERDAWLDTFPDSDAYGGETNIQSYVVKATYGLMEHVSLGTAYYHSTPIEGPSDDEDVFQVDMVFKF